MLVTRAIEATGHLQGTAAGHMTAGELMRLVERLVPGG